MASEAGKGSAQRPAQVSRETYENNWDRIFGRRTEVKAVDSASVEEDGLITLTDVVQSQT